jgi:hypothetical protein
MTTTSAKPDRRRVAAERRWDTSNNMRAIVTCNSGISEAFAFGDSRRPVRGRPRNMIIGCNPMARLGLDQRRMTPDRLTGRTLQSWYPLEIEVSASPNAPSMRIDPRPHLGPCTTAFVDETADGARCSGRRPERSDRRPFRTRTLVWRRTARSVTPIS